MRICSPIHMCICLIWASSVIIITITIIPTCTHVLCNVRGCLKQDLPAPNIYIFGFVISILIFAHGSEFLRCFDRCGTPHVYVRRTMLVTSAAWESAVLSHVVRDCPKLIVIRHSSNMTLWQISVVLSPSLLSNSRHPNLTGHILGSTLLTQTESDIFALTLHKIQL